jgi:hypothetical protein
MKATHKLHLTSALPLLAAALLHPASAEAQVGQTVTWAGGSSYKSWQGAANWTPQVVPLNNPGTNFTVIVPANDSLTFDAVGARAVASLNLGADSGLRFATNAGLTVQNVAFVGGLLEARVPGAGFTADSFGTSLGANARVLVESGSHVTVAGTPGSRYDWFGNYGPSPLFSVEGTNSLLDLSDLAQLSVNGNYFSPPKVIQVLNSGRLDLSGLIAITGARTDGYPLQFRVANSGQLDLPLLRTTEGYTHFDIELPSFTLPAFESAGSTWFELTTNSTFRVPVLTTMSGASSRLTVPAGATFEATNLLLMSDTVVDISSNGTANLPRLGTFANSRIELPAGAHWNAPPPTAINNSRFAVAAGATFGVAATTYDWTYNYGDTSLFTADGAAAVLDLKSLQSLSLNYAYLNPPKTILAANAGTIDLSGLKSITGGRTDGYPLVLRVTSGGVIDLASLQSVLGGNVTFRVESGEWTLPALAAATNTAFEVTPSTVLHAPALAVLAGGNTRLDLPFVGTFDAPNLRRVYDAQINLEVSGTLNAPQLQAFVNSSVTLSPGRSFLTATLTNLDNSTLIVSGSNNLAISAAAYDWTYSYGRSQIFSAEGDGCVLNLASIRRLSLNAVYLNEEKSIAARLNGRIDLSNLDDVHGSRSDAAPLVFKTENGGLIQLGNAFVRGKTALRAAGDTSMLKASSLTLASPATLSLTLNGALELSRSLSFSNTVESEISMEAGRLRFVSGGAQSLEVASLDGGVGGSGLGNFGISQLTVGADGLRATLRLQDSVDNGNRVGNSPEALYLTGGAFGRSLDLLAGSTLVLNNRNAYALVGGQTVRLNSLIPPGSNSVPFDAGFIANLGGPRITNLTPSVVVTPTVSSVDIAFDLPIQAASFTTADVSLTGPGGAIAATSVSPVGGTTWRINFAAQATDGTYIVRVGPNINELAANLLGLDQNQDGLSGDGTNDTFIGTFAIDGSAPAIVGAYALQNGTRVGVTFSEAVVSAWATNTSSYLVNGAHPSRAVLQGNGYQVALWVTPLTGDEFSLNATGAVDALSNTADRMVTGTILAMDMRDVGTPGANPRELGATTPFSSDSFETVAGGSDFFWNASDAGHFDSERRTGDFDLRVQVLRVDKTPNENYTQAGLMWRESLAANSRQVYLCVTPPNGGNQHHGVLRTSTGAAGSEWSYSNPGARPGVPLPNAWLRLKREGNAFIGSRSTNGLDWTELGRVTNTLPADGYLGLATSARNNNAGQTTTAAYQNYGDISPAILAQPQSQSVSSGADVTFAVSARGLPALTYQWQLNGVPLPGETSAALTLLHVTTNRVGSYRVVVSNPFGNTTSQEAQLVVDGVGQGGFEADLSPAPLGNNAVTVSDWVKVGRMVAALDVPLNSSEFARADCAPRTNALLGTLPLGDGRLSVADWTQAGRYAAVVDPLTPAGGPTEPLGGAPGINGGVLPGGRAPKDGSVRSVRLVGSKVTQGQSFTVPVELVALGGENALGFSVQFDSARLAYQGVSLGDGASGASLQMNTSQAGAGAVGVVLAKSFGQAFGAGTASVVRLQFRAVGAAGASTLEFTDTPVWREIADAIANIQPAAYVAGTVRVVAPGRLSPEVGFSGGAVELRLSGESGERYRVEVSADLHQWSLVSEVTAGPAPVLVRDAAAVGQAQRFYRAVLVP